MREKCELLEKCGFLKNYNEHAGVPERVWIKMYCEALETSESCERKMFRKQTGRPPVDNMAPTGKMLQYINYKCSRLFDKFVAKISPFRQISPGNKASSI